MSIITKQQLKKDIRELLNYLSVYILDPLHHIKNIPSIHWQSGVFAIFAINILVGLLRSFFSRSILNAVISFFITPFLAVVIITLTTLFLGYFFSFILERRLSYQKIFSILLVAYIPGFLFFIGSIFYAPLFILGVAVTSVLLVMGLVENLQIPKKLGVRLVVVGGGVVVLFWIAQLFVISAQENQPKSLDQLEQEIESLQKMNP